MDFLQIILTPFSWLLKTLATVFNSYGLALIFFALLVKVVLFPLSLKGKKGMIQMSILSGQQKAIAERYPNDKEKQNQELQKLYEQNGVNPMSGCLWSFLPLPLLMLLYVIIRRPFRYLMGLADSAITAVASALGYADFTIAGYNELYLAAMMNADNVSTAATAAGVEVSQMFLMNFDFLGIDLSQVPTLNFWANGISWNSVGLFLIPLVSAGLSLLSMVVSTKTNVMNKEQQAAAASTNRSMYIVSPLLSLWIGYSMPAGLGIYWIANSAFQMVQEVICGRILKDEYVKAQAVMEENARKAKEAEKERRRQAAERKAQALAEKKNAARRAGKGKRSAAQAQAESERLGAIQAASRVGMRTYARGRAYDPNRYPITPYHDPDLKHRPAPEEESLTEEEKAILAESGRQDMVEAAEAAAVPAPEDTAAAPQEEPEEAAVQEEDKKGFETPTYSAPSYDAPDYAGDKEEKEKEDR